MSVTLTKIPLTIQAGDTLTFTNIWTDYPATTWTLTYTLVNSDNRYTFTATADDSSYSITVASTTTNGWEAGDYIYFAKVTDGSSVYTVESGDLKILPSFSTIVDKRSYAKRMLDAIELVLEGKATNDVISYSIAGRSITKLSIVELLKARDRFKAEYQQELLLQKLNRGETASQQIKVRFI